MCKLPYVLVKLGKDTKIYLIFRRCFCKKIYFCKWWIVANDYDF